VSTEEDAETHTQELAKRLHGDPRPLCPQFRQCAVERLYPVQGYCVLSQSSGWFMVPSIEEYRKYCTTSCFGACCWFGGGGSGKAVGVNDPQGEFWPPPGLSRPTPRDTH
jgi:hypothetical protein